MKKPEVRQSYTIRRDADGMTPRQRLDAIKADRETFKHAVERGLYVHRDAVLQERREVAEILSSDLLSLGGRIGARLVGVKTPAEAKAIVDAEVVAMMKRWKEAHTVEPETSEVLAPHSEKARPDRRKQRLERADKAAPERSGKARRKAAVGKMRRKRRR
jgi:hypothetical protein